MHIYVCTVCTYGMVEAHKALHTCTPSFKHTWLLHPTPTYLFYASIIWCTSLTSGRYVKQLWRVVIDVHQANGDIVEGGQWWRAWVFCLHINPVVYRSVSWTVIRSHAKGYTERVTWVHLTECFMPLANILYTYIHCHDHTKTPCLLILCHTFVYTH